MGLVRVLLVNDTEEDFFLVRDLLSRAADNYYYDLTWCNSYPEAINAMLKSYYDLYLVDYGHGERSGLDLLHEAVQSNCTEPIIILGSNYDSRIDEEALRNGAADYLIKTTMTTDTLTKSLRYALRHHKTIQQLRNSENRFRVLFERSKDPILITDSEGLIYEANEAALNLLEITHEDILRTNVEKFYRYKSERESFTASMELSGSVKEMEVELISASGSSKRCIISSYLQISQHGNQQFYYSVFHDMSNRHAPLSIFNWNFELPGAKDLAEIMASEIYNPLSNICFAAEELQNNPDREEGSSLVSLIRKNCDRINQITSSIIQELRSRSEKSKL